jgi:hypothetical protein
LQFSTLESSVDTTQTVSRKRRSSPKNKFAELFNLVDFSDLIVENRIPSKLAAIWNDLVFNDGSRCNGDGSVLPAELVDSLKVCAKFVRAWIESAIVAESSEMDCHVRVVIVFALLLLLLLSSFEPGLNRPLLQNRWKWIVM